MRLVVPSPPILPPALPPPLTRAERSRIGSASGFSRGFSGDASLPQPQTRKQINHAPANKAEWPHLERLFQRESLSISQDGLRLHQPLQKLSQSKVSVVTKDGSLAVCDDVINQSIMSPQRREIHQHII